MKVIGRLLLGQNETDLRVAESLFRPQSKNETRPVFLMAVQEADAVLGFRFQPAQIEHLLNRRLRYTEAARNCALNHLAIIKAALGDLDKVERIVKVLGYVNVAPGFTDMPKVVNGESDLLVQLFGERGRHTRAAIGVASLSQDAPVENEITVQVKE